LRKALRAHFNDAIEVSIEEAKKKLEKDLKTYAATAAVHLEQFVSMKINGMEIVITLHIPEPQK